MLRSDPTVAGAGAVFLHTGWRSGGTWIWSRCRELPAVRALYEPLHEKLTLLRASDITALRPSSWASNHSETAPYFQEYGRLLRAGQRGVNLHRRRFAFDDFFLSPDCADAELEAYLQALLGSAGPGKVSVLKFCRSLGRVGWMERRFPQAMHAVILRDPATQWASAQALLATQKNRYFTVAPLMVLACNARHPLVRQATEALGVRPPELHSDDLAYVTEVCWRHWRRMDKAARYRQFLAFWTVTALHALHSTALVIDGGRIMTDATQRSSIEAAFRAELGADFTLAVRAESKAEAPFQRPPPLPTIQLEKAHRSAIEVVLTLGGTLAPERLQILLGHLGGIPEGAMRHRPERLAMIAATSLARVPAGSGGPRSAGQRLVTAALVLVARAVQPLRRLHGGLVQRLSGKFGGGWRGPQIT